MRMPGMDGAQLLAEVARRQPHAIRFILSGQVGHEDAFRLIATSHQFLSKPCDTDSLVNSVRRALALRDLIADEELQSLVSSLQHLPTPPETYDELVRELKSPEPAVHRVAEIVSRDVALATKVLQVASSGYFGIGGKVVSLFQAVGQLGVERVRSLVLTHGIVSKYEAPEVGGIRLERLWHHSLACGGLAQSIAKDGGLDEKAVENAFVAGLLHDIGALVLAANWPQKYETIVATSESEIAARLEVERRTLGASHARVGAYLLGLWGLPDVVVEAVAHHHTPLECLSRSFDVLTAVHVSEGLTQALHGAGPDRPLAKVMDFDYLAAVGVEDRVLHWRNLHANLLREEDCA
jgi:putative nucleotidyltransferase with HDIG domain